MTTTSTTLAARYDKYNVRVVTRPTAEQLTLDEVRDHLRIITYTSPPLYEEDALLTGLISVAREWCEWWTTSALAPQTLELGLNGFPGAAATTTSTTSAGSDQQNAVVFTFDDGILLPYAYPLIAVEQVVYDDGSGSTIAMGSGDYYVDEFQRPAHLYSSPGASWPTAQASNRRAVRIRYTAGYDLPDTSPMVNPLPFAVKAAMLLVIGHLYDNRENSTEFPLTEIPLGAASLLERYRVRLGIA